MADSQITHSFDVIGQGLQKGLKLDSIFVSRYSHTKIPYLISQKIKRVQDDVCLQSHVENKTYKSFVCQKRPCDLLGCCVETVLLLILQLFVKYAYVWFRERTNVRTYLSLPNVKCINHKWCWNCAVQRFRFLLVNAA